MYIESFACNPFSKPINPILLLGCSVWGNRYSFPVCRFLFFPFCNYFLFLSQVTAFLSQVTGFLSRVTKSLSQVTRFPSQVTKSLSPVTNFLSQVTEHWEQVTDKKSNYKLIIPNTKLPLLNIYSFTSINKMYYA